jgi:hypothetical protein
MESKPKLNEIVQLSKEDSESLAQTPLRVAAHVFVGLADWRNESYSGNNEHVTREQRLQAEKSRKLGIYN